MKKTKKPRDLAQLAKAIVDQATDDTPPEPTTDDGKNPAAVALGKLGGAKGGRARAKNMTKKQRSEAASEAAKARWKKLRKRKKVDSA